MDIMLICVLSNFVEGYSFELEDELKHTCSLRLSHSKGKSSHFACPALAHLTSFVMHQFWFCPVVELLAIHLLRHVHLHAHSIVPSPTLQTYVLNPSWHLHFVLALGMTCWAICSTIHMAVADWQLPVDIREVWVLLDPTVPIWIKDRSDRASTGFVSNSSRPFVCEQ